MKQYRFPDSLYKRLRFLDDGCIEFTGARVTGYGQLRVNGTRVLTHRLAYESEVGPILQELQLDHLCRNRACVNVDHLEPVTQRENVLRGDTIAAANAAKTHCVHGHELTTANTYIRLTNGARVCRTCHRMRVARDYRTKGITTTKGTK